MEQRGPWRSGLGPSLLSYHASRNQSCQHLSSQRAEYPGWVGHVVRRTSWGPHLHILNRWEPREYSPDWIHFGSGNKKPTNLSFAREHWCFCLDASRYARHRSLGNGAPTKCGLKALIIQAKEVDLHTQMIESDSRGGWKATWCKLHLWSYLSRVDLQYDHGKKKWTRSGKSTLTWPT